MATISPYNMQTGTKLQVFWGLKFASMVAPVNMQSVADSNPPVTLARIYEGSLPTTATQSLIYLRSTKAGPMTSFAIHLPIPMDGGDAIFNVSHNGVALFSGGSRPMIEDGESSVIVSGLDVDLLKGDEITLDLIDPGPTGVPAPISFMVDVD